MQCNSKKIDSFDVRQSEDNISVKPKVDKGPKKGDEKKKSPVKKPKSAPPLSLLTSEPSYSGAAKKKKVPVCDNPEDEAFIQVPYKVKKRTKSKPTFGVRPTPDDGADGRTGQLRAIERKAHIYLGRLHPVTSTDDIVANLTGIVDPITIKVTEVMPKSETFTYASFHVSCDHSDLDKVKNPEIWPEGTVINRYFRPFQQKQGMNKPS